MAASDVDSMNAGSVDSCAVMGDERTPLLQPSPEPKTKIRGRQYSDPDGGLVNETVAANCAHTVR